MGIYENNNFIVYDKNSWEEYKKFCYLMDIKLNDVNSLKIFQGKAWPNFHYVVLLRQARITHKIFII